MLFGQSDCKFLRALIWDNILCSAISYYISYFSKIVNLVLNRVQFWDNKLHTFVQPVLRIFFLMNHHPDEHLSKKCNVTLSHLPLVCMAAQQQRALSDPWPNYRVWFRSQPGWDNKQSDKENNRYNVTIVLLYIYIYIQKKEKVIKLINC